MLRAQFRQWLLTQHKLAKEDRVPLAFPGLHYDVFKLIYPIYCKPIEHRSDYVLI